MRLHAGRECEILRGAPGVTTRSGKVCAIWRRGAPAPLSQGAGGGLARGLLVIRDTGVAHEGPDSV